MGLDIHISICKGICIDSKTLKDVWPAWQNYYEGIDKSGLLTDYDDDGFVMISTKELQKSEQILLYRGLEGTPWCFIKGPRVYGLEPDEIMGGAQKASAVFLDNEYADETREDGLEDPVFESLKKEILASNGENIPKELIDLIEKNKMLCGRWLTTRFT